MNTEPEQSPPASPTGEDDEREAGSLVGETIAERYRLDEYIGGGGMGEVYRAEHVMMKKTVALKVLRPEAADRGNVVERFRREAQAAANLDHPNICSATDFGRSEDGSFFLVMEYVRGTNLGDILARDGALEVDRAVRIADEVADALEIAHDAGVVHRDLKPENVMLVEEGGGRETVKVLDFGVSRVQMADDMPSITKTGAVFGTPHYMSPEQAAGEEVDTRADLYGLGSLLYEMLAGRPVFEGEKSVHVMAAHLKDEPTPPSETASWQEIPPELDQLVLDLLQKDPDHRPQSATEVRGRIEVIRHRLHSAGSPSASRSIEIRMPTGKWLERAGHTTRRLSKVVERRLPFGLKLDGIGPKKLALLAVASVAVLAILGALSAYGLSTLFGETSVEQKRSDLVDDRRDFSSQPDVRGALESFRHGDPSEAARMLESLDGELTENPHYSFLLGQFRAAAGSLNAALESYGTAIDKDADYVVEEVVLSDLAYALGSSDEETYRRARKILGSHIERTRVAQRIGTVAWQSASARKRQRARKLLQDSDQLDALPTWMYHAVELRAATGCEAHAEEIEAIAETGNPAGLEVLRIYDRMPRDGCGGVFQNKDCYGCIRDDLAEAIERLEAAR